MGKLRFPYGAAFARKKVAYVPGCENTNFHPKIGIINQNCHDFLKNRSKYRKMVLKLG